MRTYTVTHSVSVYRQAWFNRWSTWLELTAGSAEELVTNQPGSCSDVPGESAGLGRCSCIVGLWCDYGGGIAVTETLDLVLSVGREGSGITCRHRDRNHRSSQRLAVLGVGAWWIKVW